MALCRPKRRRKSTKSNKTCKKKINFNCKIYLQIYLINCLINIKATIS